MTQANVYCAYQPELVELLEAYVGTSRSQSKIITKHLMGLTL